MNRVDQNINKDMIDFELIDVESLDYSDDQTWLFTMPADSGQKLDIVDWNLSCDWPTNEDKEYVQTEKQLYSMLDSILKSDILAIPDKHKFDSRTYVKPKKRVQRPSIQNIVEVPSNPPSISPNPSLNQSNKYLTYNKYSMPLGPVSPMLRLKTFNVDANTDNSTVVKEYAMKRRSLVNDDDPQLEDIDVTLVSDASERLSSENLPSKPINIDYSQPAHNLHNTFNKGITNMMHERGSLNMYQSGESLMRMSPPSLVSSLLMETSGTLNLDYNERKSLPSHRDSGLPMSGRESIPGRDSMSGRESIDPMMTSMTLSILDEKDMSTSFLSQTTHPDNDSFMDSLPPSLVSSVNSSYVVSNTSKPRDSVDSNIFSSATFTHLEKSEKLLTARPRCQLYNSFRRESSIRNSESYTKSREEACQIDTAKILNENSDNSPKSTSKVSPEMGETITLHYSNNKFRHNDAEKENLNSTFEKDDAFYKDMGMAGVDVGRNSLNVTMDKQELNEIIQARQKLSLARKALPTEPDKTNQIDTSPIKTIQLPNQTITVPRQSMENASELLSRRRAMNNGFGNERQDEPPPRDTPKRNATFKKVSPKTSEMDTTVVYMKNDENNIIDINSATLNLLDTADRTLQEEWGPQQRAMVGSSESTDTGTFSSSSPPESVPDTPAFVPAPSPTPPASRIATQIASTPLVAVKKSAKNDLLHTTISPIYDMINDKSYTLTKAPSSNSSGMERTYDMNTTVINSGTIVKRSAAKRDILAERGERKMLGPSVQHKSPTSAASYSSMAPPVAVPRKTSLPMSKLRQYSSHRELNRIPGNTSVAVPVGPAVSGLRMVRRGVYASNPALSPTAPAPPPIRRDSYTRTMDQPQKQVEKEQVISKPVLTNPPALVRQGTETLRRERPQSQLVAPKDPPTTRPYSIAGASQLRVSRPASGPVQKNAPVPVVEPPRPASGIESRMSALPRPSRLPAPRRSIRPPSVYSVAPTADMDHY